MVDKLWDDWQRRRPENFWSYHGGVIGSHSAPGIYDQFPNGGPPFINVRVVASRLAVPADVPLIPAWHRRSRGWALEQRDDL